MKLLNVYPNLARRGVWTFALPNGKVALYAPRTHFPFLHQTSLAEASRLNAKATNEWEWNAIFPEKQSRDGTGVLSTMSLMPSAHCNFHCPYCYAANAHGNAKLGEKQTKGAIEYFFSRWGGRETSLAVSILGGGEPLTAPEITRMAMRIVRKVEASTASRAQVSLVTNGSLINAELADDLLRWDIIPRISFDVLPHLQQEQRGEYAAVVRGLRYLAQAGLHPEIRTVITARSVGRLVELVDRVHVSFPEVRVVRADPVAGDNAFSLLTFADEFPERFAEARRVARRVGIMLDCMPWRLPFWGASPTFCPGEFCISPDGIISICHRKSGLQECMDAGWNYGEVDLSGTVHIDEGRLANLTRGHPVPESCASCVLGEVCRGGCRATRALNDSQGNREARCRMFRRCFELAAEEWLELEQDSGDTT